VRVIGVIEVIGCTVRGGRDPFQQETLPHPSVNLVIELHGSWVWGVPTRRDVRLLRGEGWTVGTKFKPGAFTALTGIEASSITDGRLSLKAAFGDEDPNQHESDAAPGALDAVVAEIEARLTQRAHVDDPYATLTPPRRPGHATTTTPLRAQNARHAPQRRSVPRDGTQDEVSVRRWSL
jgi:hypothetical protein